MLLSPTCSHCFSNPAHMSEAHCCIKGNPRKKTAVITKKKTAYAWSIMSVSADYGHFKITKGYVSRRRPLPSNETQIDHRLPQTPENSFHTFRAVTDAVGDIRPAVISSTPRHSYQWGYLTIRKASLQFSSTSNIILRNNHHCDSEPSWGFIALRYLKQGVPINKVFRSVVVLLLNLPAVSTRTLVETGFLMQLLEAFGGSW